MSNPFAKVVDSAPKNHLDEDKSMPQKEEEFKQDVIAEPVSEPVEVVKTAKQQILDSFGGLESNVPINSKYWKMK